MPKTSVQSDYLKGLGRGEVWECWGEGVEVMDCCLFTRKASNYMDV